MTINEYILNIQQEINSGKPYEEYVYLFEEYERYLESVIEQRPNDIVAICQLAAVLMELRYSSNDSIKPMENALAEFENGLTNDEKVRLYTNLAFFYGEDGEEEKQKTVLKKAVDLQPTIPNAYIALALCFTTQAGCFDSASVAIATLPLFEKAAKLSDEFRYQYNYAAALYSAGNIDNAKIVFEKLYQQDNNSMKAMFGLGVCNYFLGNIKATHDMANLLANIDTGNVYVGDEVSEFQIAELFYLCDDYTNHNAMFDNCEIGFHYDISWLAPYFYCLKIIGKDSELIKKYNEVVSSKKEDINDANGEELSDSYTVADRNEYVLWLQKELDDIEEGYRKITQENYKPEVSPKLYFVNGCYLMDCPRHQQSV